MSESDEAWKRNFFLAVAPSPRCQAQASRKRVNTASYCRPSQDASDRKHRSGLQKRRDALLVLWHAHRDGHQALEAQALHQRGAAQLRDRDVHARVQPAVQALVCAEARACARHPHRTTMQLQSIFEPNFDYSKSQALPLQPQAEPCKESFGGPHGLARPHRCWRAKELHQPHNQSLCVHIQLLISM